MKNSAFQEHVIEASLISFAGGRGEAGKVEMTVCLLAARNESDTRTQLLACWPGRQNPFPFPSPSATPRTPTVFTNIADRRSIVRRY